MRKVLLTLALCSCSALLGQTQLGTGALGGVVIDASGQGVPEAAVKVTNEAQGLVRNATTSGSGDFNIPALPTGRYTVAVEKTGFNRLQEKEVEVNVGASVTLTLHLEVGTVSTQVDVTSEAPPIDTTRTSEGSLINRNEIDNLPINGRRYDQFALLVPGVTRDGRFGLLSYHGTAGVFNNFTIEGNDDNQALFSEARGRTRIASSISANAIEEFQVPTTNFLPEYGRSVGGGVNSVVRSGSNQFHFDAFFYFRDADMSALDPIAKASGAKKTFEQREQFGGSIGGAILANKLFYFINYDQQVRDFPLLISDTSNVLTTGLSKNPTAADLNAFNTAVAFLRAKFPDGSPNNTLPRRFDQQSPLDKIDWIVNEKNTVSGSYNFLRWSNPEAIQTGAVLGNVGGNGSDNVRIHSVNLRLTTAFNPTLVNEARIQWGRDFEYEFADQSGPNVAVGGFSYGTATFLQRSAYPDERRYQLVDNLSVIRGKHSFKFGGEYNRAYDILNNPRLFSGAYSYSNALTFGRDLLNPSGKNYSRYQQNFGLPGVDFATIDWAFFAQDQFKITRSLTLNYGIRWDYEQIPAPFYPNPAIPETTKLPDNKGNFGPRVGLAWNVFNSSKTVIRGGYGIVYGRIANGVLFDAITQTGLTDPARNTISLTAQPTDSFAPVFPNVLPSLPTSALGSVSAYRLSKNFNNPRVQETNIGIEQQLSPGTTINVSYVHTYGDRLPIVIDGNLPAPNFSRSFILPDGSTFSVPFSAGILKTAAGVSQSVNLSRPNPNFGALSVNTSVGESWYNAMLVELKRRFTNGFEAGVSYTLAKAENTSGTGDGGGTSDIGPFGGGDVQNQFDLGANRAAAPTDQRHRGVVYFVWQPKFAKGKGLANSLLRDWGMSGVFVAETGRPYSPVISVNNLQFLGTDGNIYNGFGGIRGQGSNGDQDILPVVGRDKIYGDNNFRMDLRVSRMLQVTERFRVEVFAEAFNLTNHANYNGYNTTAYVAAATTAATPLSAPVILTPQGNFGSRSADGSQPDGTNARRLQVSLRLKF